MVRRDFAEAAEHEHLAIIAALLEACRFCERPENRERLLEMLAQPQYVGAPIQALRMSMAGTFDYGNGRVEKQPQFHVFAGEGVNEPSLEKAQWVVRNLLSSGLVKDPALVPEDRAAAWFRADIFDHATSLLTTTHP